ncbi:MAG: ABC transporter ATP-binding protein [Chloroflexi bacterium]|nr:ABC transporter ATP-binding protein [Chloroflexota bacterium]
MNDYLVQAENLHKHFGETRAVNGVDLNIKSGEIYGLVGSDGAGKTTTLRLLVGALLPNEGSVDICGYDVLKQTEQARSAVGYLSQRFSMYEDLTVLENIRFFAEVRGLSSSEWLPRSMEILDFVGLGKFKDRRAGQLSGGMKQKLGLASALVTRPRLLLLDEPTTGVDPVTRQDFWQLVIRLVSHREADTQVDKYTGKQDDTSITQTENALRTTHHAPITNYQSPITPGVSVIISTPYMDEASRCHRVGFMKNGKIIAEDTPSNLRARLNGRILELRGSPLNLLRHVAYEDAEVEDVQAFGDRLHIRVREGKAQEVIHRLMSGIGSEGGHVDELRVVPPALEDVFIALSEDKNHSIVS